jgi:hypothetical protein
LNWVQWVFLIAAIVTILGFVFPPPWFGRKKTLPDSSGPLLSVEATGIFVELHGFNAILRNYFENKKNALESEVAKAKPKSSDSKRSVISYIRDILEWELRSDYNGFRSYWRIEIKNTGQKQVSDLILRMNVGGKAVIEGPGSSTTVKTFDKELPLPILHPTANCFATIWSDDYSYHNQKEMKLTYPDGFALVKISELK